MTLSKAGKVWLLTGIIFAALAVVIGAFGAHGLKKVIQPTGDGTEAVAEAAKRLANWETGARYQMYHALGLIVVGLVCHSENRNRCRLAGGFFVLGILLFSGALYTLTLTQMSWLGAIAPLGGTSMILGWVCLAVASLKSPTESDA